MWTLEEEISPIALLFLLPPILYTCAILFGSMAAAAAADRYVTLRQSRRKKIHPTKVLLWAENRQGFISENRGRDGGAKG